MIVPDINLLVYAYNAEDPNHEGAKVWWEGLLNGTDPVGLSWVVMSGFLRLMTHPRVLENPMTVPRATEHVRSWLELPSVLTLEPGRRFSSLFLGFLDSSGAGGNLTTDAYLAALSIEHQAELHSNDSDFNRFKGLRWSNPLGH
jgi:toxin-antitoxin system PIN domain toxin